MLREDNARIADDAAGNTVPPSARRFTWPILFLPLFGALALWFLFIFRAVYNFSDPTGKAISQGDLAYTRDLFTKLPRNLDLFFFLLLFLGSAIGPGDFVLRPLRLDWRDEIERALFALATGLILFTFVMLAVGSVGGLRTRICLALFAAALLATAVYSVQGWRRWRASTQVGEARATRVQSQHFRSGALVWGIVLALALAFYLYVSLLGGISPEFNYDARWYHMGAANSYAQHKAFYNIIKKTRLAVAAVDPYQTVLYATLIKLQGLIAAKLLHWGDAFLTMLVLIYFCYAHFRSIRMGILSALIFISTPFVTWATTGGGNDLQLSLYILLSIHAFLRWRERPASPRWLIVLALMSGYALGSKLFGIYSVIILVTGVLVLGYWSFRKQDSLSLIARRLSRYLLLIGMVIFVCCLPWLIRTYAMTGNPTFPVLNSVFKSPYWNNYADASVHLAYSGLDRDQSLRSLLTVPWHAIAGNNRYRAIFGPLFFLNMPVCVALAFLSRERSRDVFRLLGVYLTAWVLLWFASGALELRYALAVMPVMAMLVAFPLTVQRWPSWSGKLFQAGLGVIVLVTTTLNFQPLVPYQQMANLPTAFGHALIPWAYLYRQQPEEQVYLLDLPVIRYMNDHLSPTTDKVYDFDGLILADAYSKITIFNGGGYDGPYGMREWTMYSPDALEHFRQAGITHLAVTWEYGRPLKKFPIWPYLREIYHSPDGNDLLYSVDYAAPAVASVVDSTIIDDYAFGTGWLPGASSRDGEPERVVEQDGQLLVTVPQETDATFRFQAASVFKPLTLEVRVNGMVVGSMHLDGANVAQTVSLDHVPFRIGTNVVQLHSVEGCTRPSDVSTSPDTRCFSVGVWGIDMQKR